MRAAARRAGGWRTEPDPKDRIAIASQMALVTSGEVTGDELVRTLAVDSAGRSAESAGAPAPRIRGDRSRPVRPRRAALARRTASAGCRRPTPASAWPVACVGRGDREGAAAALGDARRAEPGNPVVAANLGLLALQNGDFADGHHELQAALRADPLLLEARFALARALASSGDRAGALAEATKLLAQLPQDAPQRAEVERLIARSSVTNRGIFGGQSPGTSCF